MEVNPKDILFVLPRDPWPPYSGQARHCFFQARLLSSRGIDVHLIILAPSANIVIPPELAFFKSVSFFSVSLVDLALAAILSLACFILGSRPLAAQYLRSPFLKYRFSSALKTFDPTSTVVHFFSIRTAALWRTASAGGFLFVSDLIDSYSLNLRRKLQAGASRLNCYTPLSTIFWTLEYKAACFYEASLPVYPGLAAYTVVANADLGRLSCLPAMPLQSSSSPAILSSSIACDFPSLFDPVDTSLLPSSPAAVFFGALSYGPNIDAVRFLFREIMPRVWSLCPEFFLTIAGSKPSKEMVSLIASDKRACLLSNPHNLLPVLRSVHMSLAPMVSGSGQQNKVLESIACSLPVVCTSLASSPLGLDRSHVLVADEPGEFAMLMLKAAFDRPFAISRASSAFSFARDRFSWETLVDKFYSIYSGIPQG